MSVARSEFSKQYELYTELREAIDKSKDYCVTGSGCFVPLFGFDIDFVNEYGERFYLSCVPLEDTNTNILNENSLVIDRS